MKTAIVTAATDVFALSATVINLFLVEHLESMKGGDIFVLDCGLVPQSRRKMAVLFPGPGPDYTFYP